MGRLLSHYDRHRKGLSEHDCCYPPRSMSHANNKPWTVRRLLAWTTEHFAAKGICKPRVDAEWLLAHVLGVQRLSLYMDAERQPDPPQLAQFRELVKRRAKREPLQHLLGSVSFLGIEILVGPGALVPRPETEILAARAIEHLNALSAPTVVDLCTGTGCIACAIAARKDDARVWATDVSAEALTWAARNLEQLHLTDRVTLLEGAMDAPLTGKLDPAGAQLLTCNPPYVPEGARQSLPPEVQQDPPEALFAGPEGLDFYPQIVSAAERRLAPGGWLLVEIGEQQGDAVSRIMQDAGFLADITVLNDLTGRPRVVEARRPH
jgi:release factor glutamine methyltransferase